MKTNEEEVQEGSKSFDLECIFSVLENPPDGVNQNNS
jgi:hypothetical protein